MKTRGIGFIARAFAASILLSWIGTTAQIGLCTFDDEDAFETESPGTVIRLRSEILVSGGEYTLGDMAEIQCSDPAQTERLEGLVMGKSPRVGIRQPLNRRQIESRLEQQGIASSTVAIEFPKRMILERQSQDVDFKALREEIDKELRERIPFDGEIVVASVQIPQVLRLPAGILTHTTEFRFPRRPVGTVAFTLDLQVDGESQKRISGVLQIDMEVEVMQIDKGVKRGQRVDPSLCKTVKWRLSDLRGTAVTQDDFVSALVAKRDLRPGDVLSWSCVEREKLVVRGETVHMLLQTSDGMRISTSGRSMANGALGDAVEVTNASSGQRVQGIVVGKQTVQVAF